MKNQNLELLYRQFKNLPVYEMDREDFKLMCMLFLGTHVDKQVVIKEAKEPLLEIIDKRLEHINTFNITDGRLIIMLAVISKVPGIAVMYLSYLEIYCREFNIKVLEFHKFCEIFAHGFPKHDDLVKLSRQFKNGNYNS